MTAGGSDGEGEGWMDKQESGHDGGRTPHLTLWDYDSVALRVWRMD